MPRDGGTGVYSKPAGTTAVSGTTIESAKFNSVIDDLVVDLNTARPVVAGGTGGTTAAAARTALGLTIGTNVQGYSVALGAVGGLTPAADRLAYFTGASTAALATLTAFARSILDDADAATARATLGVLGDDQTWQDMIGSRAADTTYQNTTARPIQAAIVGRSTGVERLVEVSSTGAFAGEEVAVGMIDNESNKSNVSFIIPAGHFYRVAGSATISYWAELR